MRKTFENFYWSELLYAPIRVVQLLLIAVIAGIAYLASSFAKKEDRWLPIAEAPENQELTVTCNVVGNPSELLAEKAILENGEWRLLDGTPLDFEPDCYLRQRNP